MSYLEQLGLEVLIERVTDDIVGRVNAHTTAEADRIIMSNEELGTRLTEEVTQQMQQTADALASVQAAVDNLGLSEAKVAELQAALDEAVASNSTLQQAVQANIDTLASDDPAVPEV